MAADARTARRERQLQLNRLMIVGSLGSLALFAGIIAAQDAASADPAVSMSNQQVQQQDASTVLQRPRIRTRSS